ncbi:MAG TPA: Uma2 family endonuclease [Candidatus Dormibacteraeota bacterium]|nr:Uma2 family endonuclease [Candidatus Dormibacteraeota bacterium]
MASPATAHVGPWTEQDLLTLPDDGQRHELVEGRLLVSPPPSGPHQVLALRLARLLDDAAPPELQTVEGLGVRVPGGSVLVPDILVAEREAVLQDRSDVLDPGAVRLVVEIVSPGSAAMDRLTKPALYARAGIPHLWRVELEEGSVVVLRLGEDGEYAVRGVARRGGPLQLDAPFPLRLDPTALDR